MKTKFFFFVLLFMGYSVVFSQSFKNVLIHNFGQPNEPSIVIDPKNPAHIMAASNVDNVYESVDSGKTWNKEKLTSSYGVFGDPCLITDTSHHFYYFHLAQNPLITVWPKWADRVVCQRFPDVSNNWTNGGYAGLNPGYMQDKEWAVFDSKTNRIYTTWTQFDNYGSTNPEDSSNILFSYSDNQGDSWSPAKIISQMPGNCEDDDKTVEGAVPTVGSNGEVFVAWAYHDSIFFDRSFDGGNTWLQNDIFIDKQTLGWDYTISGLSRCNGLPILDCDRSNSIHKGTLYVNWSDKRNGANDADVFVSRSLDGGSNWSAPIRVNNDLAGRENFMSWLTVDQSNGDVYVLFYDRRNHNNDSTDVYLARSIDGGITFTNYKVSETPFLPISTFFFGDYVNISAVKGMVRPIWTTMNGSSQTNVYTALVDFSDSIKTSVENLGPPQLSMYIFPNPAKNLCTIEVDVNNNITLSAKVYDITNREVLDLFQNITFSETQKSFSFNVKSSGLSSGMYTILIGNNEHTKVLKFAVE